MREKELFIDVDIEKYEVAFEEKYNVFDFVKSKDFMLMKHYFNQGHTDVVKNNLLKIEELYSYIEDLYCSLDFVTSKGDLLNEFLTSDFVSFIYV